MNQLTAMALWHIAKLEYRKCKGDYYRSFFGVRDLTPNHISYTDWAYIVGH